MIKQILTAILSILALTSKSSRADHGCIDKEFDFIIVGTGSAGGVILSRLSEDPSVHVLALEAGGEPEAGYDIPMNAEQLLATSMNWNYTTVPQKNCCRMFRNQEVLYGRGKVLGGSSTINFMAYTRGNRNDFDNWQVLGNVGWSYNHVLPYFRKLEDYRATYTRYDSVYHSLGGPITVEVPEYRTPLAEAYQQALAEMGYWKTDYNAEFQEGFMDPPSNTRNHSRCGTYRGYILPVLDRPNLRVETNALVTKIIFDGGSIPTATGVQYEKDGHLCEVRARKEVIVSGGSVNSPQLLMLSGIGPNKHLEDKKITVVKNIPGVGQNLHDHLDLVLSFPLSQKVSLNPQRIFANNDSVLMYENSRTGPLTVPAANEAIAYVSTSLNPYKHEGWPDMELYFLSDHATRLLQHLLDPIMSSGMPKLEDDYFTITALLHHPKSRGTLTLKTANPHDYPLIDPQFLAHGDDLKVMAEGVRLAFQVVGTDALKKYGARIPEQMSPFCDRNEMNEQKYFECLATTWTTTSWHPVGTCKMGRRGDKTAVVDYKLRVYGVRNLRVADASIIPVIVTAHTNAVSMMIGEKAADMIKMDHRID